MAIALGAKDEVLVKGPEVCLPNIAPEIAIADPTGHDSSFATNPFGEVRLVTWTDWNFRVRHIATRRTVNEIDAYLLHLAPKFD